GSGFSFCFGFDSQCPRPLSAFDFALTLFSPRLFSVSPRLRVSVVNNGLALTPPAVSFVSFVVRGFALVLTLSVLGRSRLLILLLTLFSPLTFLRVSA